MALSNAQAPQTAVSRLHGEGVRQGVIEAYTVNGQHFTRSIRISASGGWCPQVFAIDGHEIEGETLWLDLLNRARTTV